MIRWFPTSDADPAREVRPVLAASAHQESCEDAVKKLARGVPTFWHGVLGSECGLEIQPNGNPNGSTYMLGGV